MATKEVWVDVESGGSADMFSDNTASYFNVKLSEDINLPPVSTHWEVALHFALLPSQFNNITTSNNKFYVQKKYYKDLVENVVGTKQYDRYEILVPADPGNPVTLREIIRLLNTKVPKGLEKQLNFEWNNNAKVIRVLIGPEIRVRFPVITQNNADFWRREMKFPDDKLGIELMNVEFDVKMPGNFTGEELINMDFDKLVLIEAKALKQTKQRVVKQIIRTKTSTHFIPPGSYMNAQKYLDMIQLLIEHEYGKKSIQLSLLGNRSVLIRCSDDHEIQFSKGMSSVIGYEGEKWIVDNYNRGISPMNLSNINSFNFYTPDLIGPQYVSDIKTSLIQFSAPKRKDNQTTVEYPFYPLVYYPVANTRFRIIRVIIATDTGEFVSFPEKTKSRLRFHFRPYKKRSELDY